jgi:ElaB/YqjD/DUF883 family membrane-anchored ribosome-binding protein
MSQDRTGAAERVADSVKQRVGDIAAEAARTAAESNVDEAAAAIEARYGHVLDPIATTADHVAAFVRQRPLSTIAIAVVGGFAIARM